MLKRFDKLDDHQMKSLITNLAVDNDRFVAVLDSLSDGVLVTDKQHHLVLVNRPARRLLPMYSPPVTNTLIWKGIADAEVAQFVRKALTENSAETNQEFSFGEAENTRILLLRVLPLVQKRVIQGELLLVEDVTEKKKTAAQLRQSENLASLTTLAAGVAHEVKNPLSSIGIHVQLMQKALRNKNRINVKHLEKYIGVVTEEISRLNQIVVEFLFAVRPMDIDPVVQSLNTLVTETLGFIKYELKENNIVVRRHFSDNLPQPSLDERYLKQALLNIIKNAIFAMDGGGELNFMTFQSGDKVLLQISDTGVGIPRKKLERIFEPFYTTKEYGSGLGLTLVYKILKEHGGDVVVNSKEYEGTTVTLSFPIPQSERRLLRRQSYANDYSDS